tara:strand:+ start:155 stop:694 length:540 start_codon:yes stop_codon:yes gene_type:complete
MRLLPLAFLLGCPKPAPDSKPTSSVPTIVAAFESAAVFGELGAEIAVSAGSYEGCLVGLSVGAAAASGAEAVLGTFDGATLPSIEVDVGPCLDLGGTLEGVDLAVWIEDLVDISLRIPQSILEVLKPGLCEEDARAYAWSIAALEYAQGAAGPIVDEIGSPDGVLEIPAVDVDFELCED